MKKLAVLLLTFVSCLVLFAASAPVASAWSPFGDACRSTDTASNSSACSKQSTQTTNNNSLTGPHGIIVKATSIVAMIAGIAAVIIIIVSGIRFIMSSGDPAKVTQAKNTILYAVIGLIVIVMARTIIVFVINRL
jgi:hypothetical protein